MVSTFYSIHQDRSAAVADSKAQDSSGPGPVIGRLTAGKTELYKLAVGRVEARANRHLAQYMLGSDLAYFLSAIELRLLPEKLGDELVRACVELLDRVAEGDVPESDTDVVNARLRWYAPLVSQEAVAWAHLGRSRGESLRSYLPRMYFRDTLWQLSEAQLELIEALTDQASSGLFDAAPAYNHLQHAGVTTLGEYLLGWVEVFFRHHDRAMDAFRRLDLAPPIATSRQLPMELSAAVARRLGFSRAGAVRRDGIWNEDQFSEPTWAFAVSAVEAGRLSEDLRVWCSREFSLFEIADSHASTSSSLPQKKNAFALQAIIGGGSVGVGRLSAVLSGSLSLSDQSDGYYHYGGLYEFASDAVAWTRLLAEIVRLGSFNREQLRRLAFEGHSGGGLARDMLIYDFGVPFAQAHSALGEWVRREEDGNNAGRMSDILLALSGKEFDVDDEEIRNLVNPSEVPENAVNSARLQNTLASSLATLDKRKNQRGKNPVSIILDNLKEEAKARLPQ